MRRAEPATSFDGASDRHPGMLPVSVRARESGRRAEVEAAVRAHGGTLANARDRVVEAWLPADSLEAVAALDAVTRVQSLRRPRPLVFSQGVTGHNVPSWQQAGYYGAGVKVGIIDGGFIAYRALTGREVSTSCSMERVGDHQPFFV